MLLGLLVAIWAVSWPVIKIGVSVVPPIWYASLRYLIATSCLFALVAARGELAVPSSRDWRLVVVSGVFQMAAYSAFTGLALTILPPGRASVLAFSTPLWVVPLAAWWLREPVSRRSLCGVALGLLGVLIIASPALQRHGGGQFASYAMLMSAAAAWAISIVFVRAHRFDSSALALAPWQALVATALLAPLAALIEGPPPALEWRGVASLAYVGPVATAFAYWAVVEVGRQLRASTISMALLATPSLGLLISALTLGERVSGSLATGVLLVGAGIRLATSSPPLRSRAIERTE
ncbi:MAG TPA: DMT family transporter [Gemmatimonadaceae bacterium]|nr:DMT family transporter [Gemmatimonadaceae bacterium]